jgi:methylenetetrahydrofolate dehydrogenase (NADP+)/methenyltetrahydrofolate cyclohydrolase
MILLNGKKLSEKILDNLKKTIQNRHLKLRLAVILVGENPVSQVFIRQKEKACEKVGIDFRLFQFSAKVSFPRLKRKIEKIVKDKDNSGVIIQLPLPFRFDTQAILNLVPPEKDIDVLSEESLGKFSQGTLPILPPTVSGISRLLKNYQIEIKGKNIVIVGAGRLVGYPLALWFLQKNATVSVLNKYTKDAVSFIKKADILVSGVGKSNLIRGNMVKRGVIVIDAGISVEKGRLIGDINFKEVSKKASYITPVPGGVGPMTVACLLENLIKLYPVRNRKGFRTKQKEIKNTSPFGASGNGKYFLFENPFKIINQ